MRLRPALHHFVVGRFGSQLQVVQNVGIENVIITELAMFTENFWVFVEDELDFLALVGSLGVDNEAGWHFYDGLVRTDIIYSKHARVFRLSFTEHDRVLDFWMPDAFFVCPVKEAFESHLCLFRRSLSQPFLIIVIFRQGSVYIFGLVQELQKAELNLNVHLNRLSFLI